MQEKLEKESYGKMGCQVFKKEIRQIFGQNHHNPKETIVFCKSDFQSQNHLNLSDFCFI